ncbi:MAG: hypothetical protein ABIC68_08615 [Candidatus Omnitrophota bacterium]
MVTQKEQQLNKQLFIWRVVAGMLCIVLIVFASDNAWRMLGDFVDDYFRDGQVDVQAPFQKEIKKIIEPLRYSGVERLLKPNVWTSIDFANGQWTMHNIHEFDAKGCVVLEKGRFGICQELAGYVYEKVKPLLGEKYDINFLCVAEAGFFNYPYGTHVALSIVSKNANKEEVFFLDPTFHRYGRREQFDDYFVSMQTPQLAIYMQKSPDIVMDVDCLTPLKIKDNYIIGFVVEGVGDHFNKDNFSFGLTAMRKNRYISRLIFALKMVDGKEYVVEDESLIKLLFDPKEYQMIRKKLCEMFARITEKKEFLAEPEKEGIV